MVGWPVALAVSLAVVFADSSTAAAPPGLQGFIRVSNGSFVDDHWTSLNELAANAVVSLPDGQASLDDSIHNEIVSLFQEASSNGFTAVRLFAHGQDVNFQLQVSPGKYNESVFRGIDYILALSGKYNVKAIVCTVNNWLDPNVGDGKIQYLASKKVRGMIKDHFTVVVNRRNVFTDKLYKDDDTIFGWDIYTVTTGEEGFFELSSGDADGNVSESQQMYWSGNIGQDFTAQHAFPSIDYTTIHLWPDNWAIQDPDFPRTWIEAHEAASAALGKPLVLEEFGKGEGKNATYQAVFDTLQDSLAQNRSFKGALFWRWDKDGDTDLNTVRSSNPTFQLILDTVAKVKPYFGRIVPGCTPKSVVAFG